MTIRLSAKIFSTVVLLGALLTAGCIGRHPTRTARPDLDTSPWKEMTTRSIDSGHEYRFLFLPGPSETSPAIILLHGGFFDQRMWLRTSELSEHFNVYAFEWPDNSLYYHGSIHDYGDLLADFLGTIEYTDLYLAGVSFGAYGAIDLISRHPDLDVSAFFLFSSVMFAVNEDEVDARTRIGRLALGMAPDRFRAFVEWNVERKDFDDVPGEIQQGDIFYARPYTYYYQLFSATLGQGAAPQDTDLVRCPVLVLQGTDDEIMPMEATRLTPDLFEDAEMVEFEGYDHAMVFAHGPKMVEAMVEFLKRRDLLP